METTILYKEQNLDIEFDIHKGCKGDYFTPSSPLMAEILNVYHLDECVYDNVNIKELEGIVLDEYIEERT